jgi:hypothetical protein
MDIGLPIAAIGSLLSIAGALINNLWFNHIRAMFIWWFSNIFLAVWSYGYYLKWWDSNMPGAFLCAMYTVFAVSNTWALYVIMKKYGKFTVNNP